MIEVIELIKAIKYLSDNDAEISGKDALDGLGSALNSGKSIAQMARANICQFPLLVSSSISVSSYNKAAQILEQVYANYMRMLIINNEEVIDLTKKDSKAKMLARYHQNDSANYGFGNSADYRDLANDIRVNDFFEEDFRFYNTRNFNKAALNEACKELLKPYTSNFNRGNLNGDENGSHILKEAYYDDYRELNDKILSVNNQIANLEKQITELSKAGIAAMKKGDRQTAIKYRKQASALNKDVQELKRISQALNSRKQSDCFDSGPYGDLSYKDLISIEEMEGKIRRNNEESELHPEKLEKNKLENEELRLKIEQLRANHFKHSSVSTVYSDSTIKKNNALEPSMLYIDISYNNNGSFMQSKMAVGVKCITHLIPAEEFYYFIPDSLIKKRLLFRAIQWTTGEIKFMKDFILDVDNQKFQATTDKKSVKWWRHLATRRNASKVRAFLGKLTGQNALVPNATIILSKEDVDVIKIRSKIDLLKQTNQAAKLMDIFFLMHIVVINDADDTISIFNRDTKAWEVYTFDKLEAEMAKSLKNVNLNLR